MTQAELVHLAQQGNPEAIAALMNVSLRAIDVHARVAVLKNRLHVLLESERKLSPTSCEAFIRQGLARLDVSAFPSAIVYNCLKGERQPLWVREVPLVNYEPEPVHPVWVLQNEPAESGMAPPTVQNPASEVAGSEVASAPAVASVPASTELSRPSTSSERFKSLSAQARLHKTLDRLRQQPGRIALLAAIPLFVILGSSYIWSRYLSQVSFSAASQQSPSSQPPDPFAAGIKLAGQADAAKQKAKTRDDWRRVVDQWQQAIVQLEQVPATHPKAAIARQKLPEYERIRDRLMQEKLESLRQVAVLSSSPAPQSIVQASDGRVFVQNGRYQPAIVVYSRDLQSIKTLTGRLSLKEAGYSSYKGIQQSAPAEAAALKDGSVWVSSYRTVDVGATERSDDRCNPSANLPSSFIYRLNPNLNIAEVVRVGSSPQNIAVAGTYLLVSNGCSWDISVVDPRQNREVRRIQVGSYPRGIAVDERSQVAYVALLGSGAIAAIDLKTFAVTRMPNVGKAPHQLQLAPDGRTLYSTLEGEGQLAQIDLSTRMVTRVAETGKRPRGVALSADGQYAYVVNYDSDTIAKVRTTDMQVVQRVKVPDSPVAVAYDGDARRVWVASSSGSLTVFQE